MLTIIIYIYKYYISNFFHSQTKHKHKHTLINKNITYQSPTVSILYAP